MADFPSPGSARDDFGLMQAMAGGDASALALFYDRHSPLVYATCVRMMGDRAIADELLVDIFFELFQRAGQYDASRSNPVTFLLTLTRSRAIDRRRLMGKRANLKRASEAQSTDQADPHTSGLDSAIANENGQRIRQALATLPPAQRQAIECAYYDGLSHSQIADLLNKPLGTIKTYIRQGLIQLRGCFRNDNDARDRGDA